MGFDLEFGKCATIKLNMDIEAPLEKSENRIALRKSEPMKVIMLLAHPEILLQRETLERRDKGENARRLCSVANKEQTDTETTH